MDIQLRRQARFARLRFGVAGAIAQLVNEHPEIPYQVIRNAVRAVGRVVRRGVVRDINPVNPRDIEPRNLERQFEEAAQPMKKQKVGAGVPAVVVGGPGHFQGPFKKRSVRVSESLSTQIGAQEEQEVFGSVNNQNVQYFGVQSVNWPMIGKPVCLAIVRAMFYKEFGITYTDGTAKLFHDPGSTVPALKRPFVQYIIFKGKLRTASGTWNEDRFTFGPMIMSTPLQEVVDFLYDRISGQFALGVGSMNNWSFDGYQFVGTETDGSGLTYSEVYPFRSLQDVKIALSVKTVVHLQNVTPADVVNGGQLGRDRVDANPLAGRCYTISGIYPEIEGHNADDIANFEKVFQTYDIDDRYGLIIPNGLTVGPMRSLPGPQIFTRILKCESGLRLEPGDIKTDYLQFKFYGNLSDLLHGMPWQYNDGNYAIGDRAMGTCKIWGFEKVVPTGTDRVDLSYHIDRYVNALCYLNSAQLSVRRNHVAVPFDRKLLE